MKTTYVGLLRAINVAGHPIIRMTDVRDAFMEAGCENVRTYIQSGNVVFESGGEKVLRRIHAEVCKRTGCEPRIAFRTVRHIEGIIAPAPFRDFVAGPELKLYVAFLFEPQAVQTRLPLVSEKERIEAISIVGREVFLLSRRKPNGFFGFPNNFIEKELGVWATTRNWSTVTKLAEFAARSVKKTAE